MDGKGVTYCSDNDNVNIKWGESEIEKYLHFKQPEEFFKLPRGVQGRIWNKYFGNLDEDQLLKFVTVVDKPILQSALPCSSRWNTHKKDADWKKFVKVFNRISDKKLLSLYKKFVDDEWNGGAESLAELFPFRVLPLLVNTVNKEAKSVIEKRLKEGK